MEAHLESPSRIPAQICLACGYDGRGLKGPVCPECGEQLCETKSRIATARAEFVARSVPVVRWRLSLLAAAAMVTIVVHSLSLNGMGLAPALTSVGWLLLTSVPAVILPRAKPAPGVRVLSMMWLRGLPLLHAGWLASWIMQALVGPLTGRMAGHLAGTRGYTDVYINVLNAASAVMPLMLVACAIAWCVSAHRWNRRLSIGAHEREKLAATGYYGLGLTVLVASMGCCAFGYLPLTLGV